jgi:starvation-inducible DNA-binding protein
MFPTKNDLPVAQRIKLVELLNARLADAIDLALQSKQAHWNVKGPGFIALHELFDATNAEVLVYVDTIAERVVQLGGVAEGGREDVAKNSSLPAYAPRSADSAAHVEAFSTALAAFGKLVREAIDKSQALGDAGTADLFTGVSRGVDKSLWFVEAHQQVNK